MARTKQWPRKSYPKKKAIRRYDSDDEDSDDSNNNNDFGNDDMEIEDADDQQDGQNAEEIKEDEALANAPPASADYLGPPRKPLNAFYYFKVDEFDVTRAANPTLTTLEVIDVIGQKWGDLDEAKKAEYQEKFEKHKDLYEESLKPRVWKPPVIPKSEQSTMFTMINPEIAKMGTSMEISDVKPAPPKKPLTAFFLYKHDVTPQVKEENPDAKITEITKIIASQWKEIDQETKAAYEVKHNEAKQRYEQEMKEYEEKYGTNDKKKKSKAKEANDVSEEEDHIEQEKPKETTPAPPKRPLTAFFLYKHDVTPQVKEENPDAKITEITKIIAKNWGGIDKETKAAYEARSHEAQQRYEQEMKEYEEKYGKIQKKKRGRAKGASDASEEEEHSEEEKEKAKPGKASLKKAKKA